MENSITNTEKHNEKHNKKYDTNQHAVILFDGVCNLCNASVDFVLKRDKKAFFKFVSLQSETGKNLLETHGIKNQKLDTVMVIYQKKVYQKSSAVLFIARKISGFWFLFNVFVIVPPFLRDVVYSLVAKNRYRFFGKKNTCRIATSEEKMRFL